MSRVSHLQFMEQLSDVLQARPTLLSRIFVQDRLEELEHSGGKQPLIPGTEEEGRWRNFA